MSELPPNIDAILASIRSRMTEDGTAKPETPAAPAQPPAAGPVASAVAAPVAAPVIDGGQTLEALLRSMLQPMLQTWLDANMPEIVERLAQAEIKRLTGRD
jgi:cell pole-organizing protein PopZ